MRGNLANGFTVMDWMSKRLGLTSAQTVIYACLYDASMHGKRPVIFSTSEIGTLCNISCDTVRRALTALEREKLICNQSREGYMRTLEIDTDTLRRYHLGGF